MEFWDFYGISEPFLDDSFSFGYSSMTSFYYSYTPILLIFSSNELLLALISFLNSILFDDCYPNALWDNYSVYFGFD